MTKQINHCRRLLLLAIIASITVLCASDSIFAQKGVGEKYNARDPQPCSKTASKTNKPTVAEAVASVICNTEGEWGINSLYLVEDVKVTQIGKGTPHNPLTHTNTSDIDLDFLIYPIRGSLKRYSCSKPGGGEDSEKSCLLYDEQDARGNCYKNGFAQWVCSLTDLTAKNSTRVVPPGGATTATADTPGKDKPNDGKKDNQVGATKGDTAAILDANGFPKPNFSEMEKYLEVVDWDYDFTLGKFFVTVKKKVEKIPVRYWKVTWQDAKGVEIGSYTITFVAYEFAEAKVGESIKGETYVPNKSDMRKVKTVVVTESN